jgi:Ca2+-binding EF-hand superfamily protein
MLNPEYAEEGDLLSEPHPAVTQRGLEFAEEDAYAAQEKDAELRELVHSEEFVEFTNVVFDEASLDGDENMDPVELFNAICVLMTRMEHSYEPSAEQVMAFFKLFDEDQNNHLDREEFLRFCQQLIMYVESFAYVKEDPAASDAIAAIFAECDTQGGGPDGMLVFEEVWSAVALLNQQLPVSLRLRLDEEAVGAYIAMFRESDNGPEGLTLPAFRDMIESLIGLVAE